MAILDDLGAFLATAGVGTVGTNIFLGRLPDDPDKCLALFESPVQGGPQDTFGRDTAPVYELPGLQVQSRAATYTEARSFIQSAWNELVKIGNETLTATYYLRCEPLESPVPLDRDDAERMKFKADFRVWKNI